MGPKCVHYLEVPLYFGTIQGIIVHLFSVLSIYVQISSNISFHGGVEVIAGSASLTIESRDVNLQPEDQDQLFVRPATYKASLNVTDSREVDLTSIRSRFVSIVNFIGGTGARVYHSSIASRSEGAITFQPSST